jgi:hypothetical protein
MRRETALTPRELASFNLISTLKRASRGLREVLELQSPGVEKAIFEGRVLPTDQRVVYVIDALAVEECDSNPSIIERAFDSKFESLGAEPLMIRGNIAYQFPQKHVPMMNIRAESSLGNLRADFSILKDVDLDLVENWHWPDVYTGQEVEIALVESSVGYRLIPNRAGTKDFFPGFKTPFWMSYENDAIQTHVTSKGTCEIGSRKGNYISKGIGELVYKKHAVSDPIKAGDSFVIQVVDPGREYRITEIKRK